MEEKKILGSVKHLFTKCMWWKHEKKMDKNTKIAIVVAILVILAALCWYGKGIFIAATVDGHVVTRWEVIKETEKQSGKAVLDSLIAKKIFENAEAQKGLVVSSGDLDAIIAKIDASVRAQGGTIEKALAQQGMTMEQLRSEIKDQEMVKRLLADKIVVTNEEVTNYMTENKITAPKGEEADMMARVKDYLEQQKLGKVAQDFLTSARLTASIKYYVNYPEASQQQQGQ